MTDPNDLRLVLALEAIKDELVFHRETADRRPSQVVARAPDAREEAEVVSGRDNVVDETVGCCEGASCDRKPNLVEVTERGWRPPDTHSDAAVAAASRSRPRALTEAASPVRRSPRSFGFPEPESIPLRSAFEARRILGLAPLVEPDRVADDL